MLKWIGILTLTLWLGLSGIAFAAMPRGVVTSEDAANFTIVRDGEEIVCQKGEFLYDGDVVKGDNVSSLTVEWHPYAKTALLNARELKVGYEAPGSIDVALYKVKSFLGLVDNEVTVQYGATRGIETKEVRESVYPLPGFNATVLQGEPIGFAWGEARGKKLVIKDSKKQVVKTVEISGQSGAELTVDALGITDKENYTWQIEGTFDQYKLRLLNTELTEKIKNDLKSIEANFTNTNEQMLNKAVYLQLVSDASPAQVDLYWLSYQMLQRINVGDDVLLKHRVEKLKSNIVDHIGSMR